MALTSPILEKDFCWESEEIEVEGVKHYIHRQVWVNPENRDRIVVREILEIVREGEQYGTK